jgi:Carboxypeptidase regulatory-like domain
MNALAPFVLFFVLFASLSSPASARGTPALVQQQSTSARAAASSSASGNISGTVLDTNGDLLQSATVALTALSDSTVRTLSSGGDGQFSFEGLPPDDYRLSVAAPGMVSFTSARIVLKTGQAVILPPIRLALARATTTVTVLGNSQQLSQQLSIEQMHIAEQQRVLRVFPNFYSSYDWNAPPMRAKQKFQLGLRTVFDPVSFFTIAAVAGAEQYENIFPAYGSGLEGYGKRYGAAMANHASADLLSRAVYPSIFHQDPRYFYKGAGGFRARAFYAISAAFMARSDNGRWEPNYSGILGNFSAAAISNLYYPAANRGVSLIFLNGLAETGADAGSNLVREFILKRFTSHAPKSAAGQGALLPLH